MPKIEWKIAHTQLVYWSILGKDKCSSLLINYVICLFILSRGTMNLCMLCVSVLNNENVMNMDICLKQFMLFHTCLIQLHLYHCIHACMLSTSFKPLWKVISIMLC